MTEASEPRTAAETQDPAAGPAPHPQRWLILSTLCLAVMLVLLDNTVLTVAIPSMTESLNASTSAIQWVMNGYTLAVGGLLMTTGSLADRIGRRKALLIGVALFTICSGVASMADSPAQLIAGRVGMGVGAALLMPSTLAVLMQVFDEKERPKAIGVWTGVAAAAVALGPVLGGFMLDHFWWGSVLLINVPVGLAALISMIILIPESRDPQVRRTDVPGVALSILMSVGLVYAIISVPEHGWSSPQTLIPFAVGAAALISFTYWERRCEEPMLDVALFRNPAFSGAVGSTALTYLALSGSLFLFTQYLQFVLDYSPLEAGLGVVPMALALMVMTPFGPKIAEKIGTPATMATGLAVMGAGLVTLSFLGEGSGYLLALAGLAVMGAGAGIAMPTASTAMVSAIPVERAGVAGGLNSTMQEFGSACGVAVMGSLAAGLFASRLPDAIPDEATHSIGQALGVAAAGEDPSQLVEQVRDAFVSGFSVSMRIGAAAAVAAGLVAWALLRRNSVPPEEAATQSAEDTAQAPAPGAEKTPDTTGVS
ncbi:MFS transporter [Streptomyces flaveolus]|uniref:MFS transporter n=1 Tax=Streptomyces flaveolus TaxID=67297 RepID=UPI00343F0C3F